MQNKAIFTKEEVCEMLREMQMETVRCQGFIIGHVTQLWVIREMLGKRLEKLGEKGIDIVIK